MPFFKFEDEKFQDKLLSRLSISKIDYNIDENNSVKFEESHRNSITDVFHSVRDDCFKWYFLWWDNRKGNIEFEKLMKARNMQFYVELHDSERVYLLPKEFKYIHQELSAEAEN